MITMRSFQSDHCLACLDGSSGSKETADHGGDRQLTSSEVVTLGQIIGDVLLAQAVVGVALYRRERILIGEVHAGDEDHPGRAADRLGERLATLVATPAVEACALRESPLVGISEARSAAMREPRG
jgi:hypothetical protein